MWEVNDISIKECEQTLYRHDGLPYHSFMVKQMFADGILIANCVGDQNWSKNQIRIYATSFSGDSAGDWSGQSLVPRKSGNYILFIPDFMKFPWHDVWSGSWSCPPDYFYERGALVFSQDKYQELKTQTDPLFGEHYTPLPDIDDIDELILLEAAMLHLFELYSFIYCVVQTTSPEQLGSFIDQHNYKIKSGLFLSEIFNKTRVLAANIDDDLVDLDNATDKIVHSIKSFLKSNKITRLRRLTAEEVPLTIHFDGEEFGEKGFPEYRPVIQTDDDIALFFEPEFVIEVND